MLGSKFRKKYEGTPSISLVSGSLRFLYWTSSSSRASDLRVALSTLFAFKISTTTPLVGACLTVA